MMGKGNIRVVEKKKWDDLTNKGKKLDPKILQDDNNTTLLETAIKEGTLSLQSISKIATHILSPYDMSDMFNNEVSIWGFTPNYDGFLRYNSTIIPNGSYARTVASIIQKSKSVEILYILHNVLKKGNKISGDASWANNYYDLISVLYVHEYLGRHKNSLDNVELYKYQIEKNKELKLNVSEDYKNHLLRHARLK